MTEQELQIAVCKELGWTLKQDVDTGWTKVWLSPNGVKCQKLPPLALDLMHEAEKTLTYDQKNLYFFELAGKLGTRGCIMANIKDRATAFIAVKKGI